MNGVFASCKNTQILIKYPWKLICWTWKRMTQTAGMVIITMTQFISRMR